MAHEIFADRAYTEDGLLMDRRTAGAVILDPKAVCTRILAMLHAGAIITAQGTHLPTQIDTICLHGDTPGALQIARALHDALAVAGVGVAQFRGRRAQHSQ